MTAERFVFRLPFVNERRGGADVFAIICQPAPITDFGLHAFVCVFFYVGYSAFLEGRAKVGGGGCSLGASVFAPTLFWFSSRTCLRDCRYSLNVSFSLGVSHGLCSLLCLSDLKFSI